MKEHKLDTSTEQGRSFLAQFKIEGWKIRKSEGRFITVYKPSNGPSIADEYMMAGEPLSNSEG
tara:strand:+ start:524 stop:712 length:189 start_codon:yes stop_codon:yes gene_type:complete